jgi:hypothetical protein
VYHESLQIFAVIVVTIVGMGSSDHVRDAVGSGRSAHGDRDVPGLGSVIYFRKNVRMNVNHGNTNVSMPLRAALLHDLNRFAGKDQEK